MIENIAAPLLSKLSSTHKKKVMNHGTQLTVMIQRPAAQIYQLAELSKGKYIGIVHRSCIEL